MPHRRPHRLLRHVVTDHLSVKRAFHARAALAQHRAGDRRRRAHASGTGLLRRRRRRCRRCACCASSTPRERALEVFGLLRVWDTEENAGVLVYLLLADRDVEIVADRGIDRVVDSGRVAGDLQRGWRSAFREGRYAGGRGRRHRGDFGVARRSIFRVRARARTSCRTSPSSSEWLSMSRELAHARD